MIRKGDRVLFQGDSITDTERKREVTGENERLGLGAGYAFLASARLLSARPQQGYRFLNRGISGNRIVDLFARWQEDTLNLKPDLISILIGVNDTWHRFSRGGVAPAKYERVFRMLLQETKEALPQVRLVLCEPFVLSGGVVTSEWLEEMVDRRERTRRLAEEFGAAWVPFQEVFDQALKERPFEYWLKDGVHPTPAGHERMAQAWLKAVAPDL
jgi:lysophospholipase L1-like esterase